MGDPLVHRGTGAGGHPLTMRDTAHPLKTVLKPMLRRRGGLESSAPLHPRPRASHWTSPAVLEHLRDQTDERPSDKLNLRLNVDLCAAEYSTR